ncbi:MAG: HAMP domain-containing histidine kinase [Endomicrobiales bacterium]|nr:HAMP domain-containing histidine kinase [Endomicrobiales bacterium]
MMEYLRKTFSFSEKTILLILRFLMFFVMLYLTIYNFQEEFNFMLLTIIFSVFLCSNLVFVFLDDNIFRRKTFRYGVFLFDVVIISSVIYFTRGIDTDLYLAYFLIIFIASGTRNIAYTFISTIVVASIYSLLLTYKGVAFSFDNPALLLRIPFFFIVSFIFLYYAQIEKRSVENQVARMDRLSMLGEMLAAVLHELKNPLTIILGYASELDKTKDVDRQREIWQDIVEAVQKSSKIVKNILSYVKYSDESEKLMIGVNDLVNSTIDILNEQLKINRIEVVRNLSPDLPQILGNYGYLQQVFLNLINNARNVLIQCKGLRQVTVSTFHKGKKIIISVKDNGPGIKKESLDKIFDPFFTTRTEGTGLGLSLCFRIVKKHKGNIYVKSKYGEGAEFFVELPIGEND